MLTLVGRTPKDPRAIVINVESFNPELFTAFIPGEWTHGDNELTITTVDLLGVIRRIEQTDVELHCSTWTTLNSLSVLAQNDFCELTYFIRNEKLLEYYNLTKVENPYWALSLYLNPVRNRYFPEPIIFWDEEGKEPKHREVYARVINDAYNTLLKYPLDKVWYSEPKQTWEENRKWVKEKLKLCKKAAEWLSAGVVINDGTKPLEF